MGIYRGCLGVVQFRAKLHGNWACLEVWRVYPEQSPIPN